MIKSLTNPWISEWIIQANIQKGKLQFPISISNSNLVFQSCCYNVGNNMTYSMNTDNCFVLFSVEFPKFHCTNPILYKKEKKQIRSSSKLNLKNQ